jgi:hypothetical protein
LAGEDLASDPEGRARRWPARVVGEVRYRLDQLVASDAVLDRAPEVERQFVRVVTGDERGGGHEASVPLRESGALRDLAEEDALGQVVEGGGDVGIRATRRGRLVSHVLGSPSDQRPVIRSRASG